MDQDKKQKIWDNAIKALAVVGLVALIIILARSGLALIGGSNLAQVFTSLNIEKKEELNLEASARAIKSKEFVVITWNTHDDEESGTYLLSYPCLATAKVSIVLQGQAREISCNSDNAIGITNRAVLNIATDEVVMDLPIHISFEREKDRKVTATENVVITITNSNPKRTPSTGSNGVPSDPPRSEDRDYTIPGTTTSPLGKPDLFVKIIDTGISEVSSSTTTDPFVSTSTLRSGMLGVVKFEVRNLGAKESGNWYFNAVLPTLPWHIFTSASQRSLNPGDRIEFTLRFDRAFPDRTDANVGTISIYVDPANSIQELNENNNLERKEVRIIN